MSYEVNGKTIAANANGYLEDQADWNEDVAKVIDFGLVALARSTPSEGNRIFGTPGYMAPEQLRGEETDRRARDAWDLAQR